MPRVDVSDYLELTGETLSRSLTKLKNKGIIKLHGAPGHRDRGVPLIAKPMQPHPPR
ncbi:hypothetical protein [Sinorhizobium meliloti]|uniref:hypothetical protein n=1 Tax=Rhizobium meliloti TaxID=382 RepID=UPI001F41A06C|nr:hypothetical protein [Sinorhizobium meliloti]